MRELADYEDALELLCQAFERPIIIDDKILLQHIALYIMRRHLALMLTIARDRNQRRYVLREAAAFGLTKAEITTLQF